MTHPAPTFGELTQGVSGLLEAHILKHMPAPPTLWHYTTAAGLVGILTSAELWATDIRYLNDASEYRYTISILDQLLERQERKDAGHPRAMLWKTIRNLPDFDFAARTYVFSLSEVHDHLSQWRGYSSHGNGYALGFDMPSLMPSTAEKHFMVIPCNYVPKEQQALLETLIADTATECDRLSPGGGKPTPAALDRSSTVFALSVAVLAPILKHPRFAEEREWRLISSVIEPDDRQVCFRIGQSTVVPYFRLPLTQGTPGVTQVVVGPAANQDLAKLAVQKLVRHTALQVRAITMSEVPFRQV